MPKTQKQTKIVEEYRESCGDGTELIATVTSFPEPGTGIYIELWQGGTSIPLNFDNIDRDKAAALHKLLGEILKDHKA